MRDYRLEDVVRSNLSKMFYCQVDIKAARNGESVEFHLDNYDAKSVPSSTVKRWFKEEGIKVSVCREAHYRGWSSTEKDGYDYTVKYAD